MDGGSDDGFEVLQVGLEVGTCVSEAELEWRFVVLLFAKSVVEEVESVSEVLEHVTRDF